MHNYMELVEDKKLVIILMFVLKEIVNSIHMHLCFVTLPHQEERRVMGHFLLPSILVEAARKNSFF